MLITPDGDGVTPMMKILMEGSDGAIRDLLESDKVPDLHRISRIKKLIDEGNALLKEKDQEILHLYLKVGGINMNYSMSHVIDSQKKITNSADLSMAMFSALKANSKLSEEAKLAAMVKVLSRVTPAMLPSYFRRTIMKDFGFCLDRQELFDYDKESYKKLFADLIPQAARMAHTTLIKSNPDLAEIILNEAKRLVSMQIESKLISSGVGDDKQSDLISAGVQEFLSKASSDPKVSLEVEIAKGKLIEQMKTLLTKGAILKAIDSQNFETMSKQEFDQIRCKRAHPT